MKATRLLPPGYARQATINLASRWNAIGLNVAAVGLLLAFGLFFLWLGSRLRPDLPSTAFTFTVMRGLVGWRLLLAVLAGVTVLHEGMHGLFYWLFTGERPRFGLGPFYAYAAAPHWYLARNPFVAVGLAPLLLLTAAGTLALPWLPLPWVPAILLAMMVNAAGAIGDLAVVLRLLPHPRASLVRDEGASLYIYVPVADPRPYLEQRWQRLMQSLGVRPALAATLFARLYHQYAEGRHYHNPAHLLHMLQLVDQLVAEVHRLPALQLAVWYHDVVYDPLSRPLSRPLSGDNEAASADYAKETLANAGLPPPLVHQVARLIQATDHQTRPDDPDACVLLDADLAILAADPATYDRYRQAIRQEYGQVPEERFRAGRREVVGHFLGRERLFHTVAMAPLEPLARANLQREWAELAGGPMPAAQGR